MRMGKKKKIKILRRRTTDLVCRRFFHSCFLYSFSRSLLIYLYTYLKCVHNTFVHILDTRRARNKSHRMIVHNCLPTFFYCSCTTAFFLHLLKKMWWEKERVKANSDRQHSSKRPDKNCYCAHTDIHLCTQT